ncbi:hypothetical protein [Rhizobium sp. FKL33]|uniref:hypothetical protein n=1 Tax=Rhizobium sp. FKL33 TaxID=2562307 RepID=UPI0010BFB122|nr:hypothetical protein [Rhizobium sp. FKL33]
MAHKQVCECCQRKLKISGPASAKDGDTEIRMARLASAPFETPVKPVLKRKTYRTLDMGNPSSFAANQRSAAKVFIRFSGAFQSKLSSARRSST